MNLILRKMLIKTLQDWSAQREGEFLFLINSIRKRRDYCEEEGAGMKFSKKTLLASLALTSFYVVQVNGARDVCQSSYHDNRPSPWIL